MSKEVVSNGTIRQESIETHAIGIVRRKGVEDSAGIFFFAIRLPLDIVPPDIAVGGPDARQRRLACP